MKLKCKQLAQLHQSRIFYLTLNIPGCLRIITLIIIMRRMPELLRGLLGYTWVLF